MSKPNIPLIIVWLVLVGIFCAVADHPKRGGADDSNQLQIGGYRSWTKDRIVHIETELLKLPAVFVATLYGHSVRAGAGDFSEADLARVGAGGWGLVLISVIFSRKRFIRYCSYGLALFLVMSPLLAQVVDWERSFFNRSRSDVVSFGQS